VGSLQPGPHLVQVALEKLQAETDQAREPYQSIRFLWLESLGVLAAPEGPRWNLKKFRDARCREIKDLPELLKRLIREALAHARVQLRRIVGTEA
jgi:hypothetical protein